MSIINQTCPHELPDIVDFNSIPWRSTILGARSKVYQQDGKQIRLIEFTDEFVDPEWCEKGHVGYALEGKLEVDFKGRIVVYTKGSGIFIPSGIRNAHKARSITPVVQLVLVEEPV